MKKIFNLHELPFHRVAVAGPFPFVAMNGVKQRDELSSLIFNLVLNYLVKGSKRKLD